MIAYASLVILILLTEITSIVSVVKKVGAIFMYANPELILPSVFNEITQQVKNKKRNTRILKILQYLKINKIAAICACDDNNKACFHSKYGC